MFFGNSFLTEIGVFRDQRFDQADVIALSLSRGAFPHVATARKRSIPSGKCLLRRSGPIPGATRSARSLIDHLLLDDDAGVYQRLSPCLASRLAPR
jgi:hypothetical protein